jgi:hypothetical protein
VLVKEALGHSDLSLAKPLIAPHLSPMPEITSRLSTALADRYKIERRLGEDGMATVYPAEDLKHKYEVKVERTGEQRTLIWRRH